MHIPLSSQSELASGHRISQSVPLVSPLTLIFISVCSSVSFLHNSHHPYFHLCPSLFLAHTFAMWWTTQHCFSWWMVSFLMSIIELPTCLAFLPAQTHTGNLWLVSMSLTCTDAMYLPPMMAGSWISLLEKKRLGHGKVAEHRDYSMYAANCATAPSWPGAGINMVSWLTCRHPSSSYGWTNHLLLDRSSLTHWVHCSPTKWCCYCWQRQFCWNPENGLRQL